MNAAPRPSLLERCVPTCLLMALKPCRGRAERRRKRAMSHSSGFFCPHHPTLQGFGAFDRNILTQVEQVLSEPERLIRRTQIKRSEYRVLGGPSSASSGPAMEGEVRRGAGGGRLS